MEENLESDMSVCIKGLSLSSKVVGNLYSNYGEGVAFKNLNYKTRVTSVIRENNYHRR